MKKQTKGFTLIELMIVVSIIGMLATVALPELTRARLRAQTAERGTMMEAVARGAADVVGAQQAIPGPVGSTTWIGIPNPPGAPGMNKRPFQVGLGNWAQVPISVQGGCYYSYSFLVSDPVNGGADADMSVTAEGDLDGVDGPSIKTLNFKASGYVFRTCAPAICGGLAAEVPPAGQEDQGTF